MQWQHPVNGRWYRADVAEDLFGTPGIDVAWGGRQRPRSGHAFIPLASYADAANALATIDKRRRGHGYLRVVPDSKS